MTPTELHRLIEKHKAAWLSLPGVRGVGGKLHGDDGWLVVYTDWPIPTDDIPLSVDGVRVEVVCREGVLV